MLTWWGIMLTWWGIMLDVVDTPYRGVSIIPHQA